MTLVGPFRYAAIIRRGPLSYAVRVYKFNDLFGSDTGRAFWTSWGARRAARRWCQQGQVGDEKIVDYVNKEG